MLFGWEPCGLISHLVGPRTTSTFRVLCLSPPIWSIRGEGQTAPLFVHRKRRQAAIAHLAR
jgi:hypothetical protein